jgi:mono/diheme cytochrome c family protein
MRRITLALLLAAGCSEPAPSMPTASASPPSAAFLEKHCFECHDGESKKGGLDLAALEFVPGKAELWVKIHDRIEAGEMPPAKQPRPDPAELRAYLESLAAPLAAFDRAREAGAGRATWRRLNRAEYEHSIRDLLGAPWLQIKEMLPEDGEAHRFNKSGEALDVSHVQMAQYLAAADFALREVLADPAGRPESRTVRHHARDSGSFSRKMFFNEFNRSPERATFPVLGFEAQPEVRAGKQPVTVGAADPATREREAIGVVAGAYEPLEPKFNEFKAPRSGRYRLRISAYSVWAGPGKEPKWWTPDLDRISRGRRSEPVTLYAELPPRQLRRLGAFDAHPDPGVAEFDVHLLKGETIRPDPSRLFRSRPPNWRNPLATREGSPGVAYRWIEVEGPIIESWPPAGHRLMFGEGPADPERLLRSFMAAAYRRPVEEADVARFLEVIRGALDRKVPFVDAMIAGYSAVLCSPGFTTLQERPGALDPSALASRLSYFLWNSPPDAELKGADLARPESRRTQADRLLADPRTRRFVDAFLDYWLDLRRIDATSPDAALYPDYYLDDLLTESAAEEPRAYFLEHLRADLPARGVVDADFAMLNERLAAHYGLPPVEGTALRRVPLPPGSVRGGFMTMAAVLKVTANGTTTSPVLRGAWIVERILGKTVPPPPASVPAVEPDIRGATTIREQLDKHRNLATCAGCHVKIDPPGFALENFDVFGGWRERYRALGEGTREIGWGKNGQPFEFHAGPPVDASGTLPGGGGAFRNVVELKRLLLKDERAIARNLVRQLVVYATGAPVRFGERAEVEAILDRCAPSGYGVRTILREIALSGLFGRK